MRLLSVVACHCKVGLNPYSNGIYSMSVAGYKGPAVKVLVLILILMEYTL